MKSTNPKYKAVIFDLFGTLVDKLSLRGHKKLLEQMAALISAPPEEFIKLWFDTFDERGLGVFKSLEANIEYICQKLEIHPEKAKIALASQINIQYTARAMKPRPYAAELLSRLKAGGYQLGLITNCSAEIPKLVNGMAFSPFLDVAVYSSLEGVQKPDRRIYQLTTERLSVKPEECLYAGDGDCNELTGALQAGMHPVLVRNPDEDITDVHRVDFEADRWDGPVISSLKEVLNYLE
jgi:putative hydrolase of the HAD superfamily